MVENTTFGMAFQIRANSSSSGPDGAASGSPQTSMVSYNRRPISSTPMWRVCSTWNRNNSPSGAVKPMSPPGPAMKPSSDTLME